jgi:hypothetical protein
MVPAGMPKLNAHRIVDAFSFSEIADWGVRSDTTSLRLDYTG